MAGKVKRRELLCERKLRHASTFDQQAIVSDGDLHRLSYAKMGRACHGCRYTHRETVPPSRTVSPADLAMTIPPIQMYQQVYI